MIVVPFIPVEPSDITSSSIPVIDASCGEVAFASGTFVVGDERIDTTVNKRYACLIAGTHSITPSDDPTNWLYMRRNNRHAMFDAYKSTQTKSATPIVATVTLHKRVDTVMFARLKATSVKVEMIVGGTVIFEREVNLQVRDTRTATDYCFAGFNSKESAVVQGLYLNSGASLRFTITNANGDAACGSVIYNRGTYLGDVEYGAQAGSLNYSKIISDEIDGELTLVPRKAYKKTNQSLIVEAKHVNKILAVKAETDAAPAGWIGLPSHSGSDYFEMLNIVGIWRELEPTAAHFGHARVALDLQEI